EKNSYLGYAAGQFNVSGSNNTILGYEAGKSLLNNSYSNSTLIGYNAGYNLRTNGNNNVLLGFQAGNSLTSGASNIIIGYDEDSPTATTSNHLNIGGAIYGDLSSGEIYIGNGTNISTITPTGFHGGNIYADGMIYGGYTGSGDAFQIGDDLKLTDINIANTVGFYGLQDSTIGSIKLGSAGTTISGYNNNIGIGTTSPGQKLTVAGTIESTSGGIKFPDGKIQVTSGKIINVYFAITPATRQTINSTTPQIITGLSITLTPVSANSKFMILAIVNGNLNHVASVLIYKEGTKLLSHEGNTNEFGAQATKYTIDAVSTSYMSQLVVNYVDSPATTSSITYDVRMTSGWSGTSYTSYANDRGSNDMRTPSTFMIMEIAE
ncbi:MAG: hypothetical protein KAJ48_10690, partial [Elusimicrobiales bacterium]|nr:hypothetical protein [Elusimicrobiales bacterium]